MMEEFEKYKEPEERLRKILDNCKTLEGSAKELVEMEQEQGLTGNRRWNDIVHSVLTEYANRRWKDQ